MAQVFGWRASVCSSARLTAVEGGTLRPTSPSPSKRGRPPGKWRPGRSSQFLRPPSRRGPLAGAGSRSAPAERRPGSGKPGAVPVRPRPNARPAPASLPGRAFVQRRYEPIPLGRRGGSGTAERFTRSEDHGHPSPAPRRRESRLPGFRPGVGQRPGLVRLGEGR